jgi:hypothetical protein
MSDLGVPARRDPVEQEAVVVFHCSDPRYQAHFADFLRLKLGLDRYALVAVPGGPQCLVPADYLPKFAWAGWRWMKFLGRLMRPERLILIAHDDCRWYIENGFAPDPAAARDRQVQDLHRVRAEIVERFAGARVDLFYATLETTGARFEPL